MNIGRLLIGVAAACMPLFAQEGRLRLEILPGVTVPVQRFGGADLSAGGGVEGNISYRFAPHLAIYGGWDWHNFRTSSLSANQDLDVEETGYVFGLRFEHPIRGEASPTLVLRFGGAYNHVEIENSSGDIIADSKHGLGWEAGAGVGLRVGENWRVTPGARFRSLSRDFGVGSASLNRTLRYVVFEVGISRSF